MCPMYFTKTFKYILWYRFNIEKAEIEEKIHLNLHKETFGKPNGVQC